MRKIYYILTLAVIAGNLSCADVEEDVDSKNIISLVVSVFSNSSPFTKCLDVVFNDDYVIQIKIPKNLTGSKIKQLALDEFCLAYPKVDAFGAGNDFELLGYKASGEVHLEDDNQVDGLELIYLKKLKLKLIN